MFKCFIQRSDAAYFQRVARLERAVAEGWFPDMRERMNFLEGVHIQAHFIFRNAFFHGSNGSLCVSPKGEFFVIGAAGMGCRRIIDAHCFSRLCRWDCGHSFFRQRFRSSGKVSLVQHQAGNRHIRFNAKSLHKVQIQYLLFLPNGYERSVDRWPLILYLHGGSLRGDDIRQMKKLGLAEKVEADPNFPFIVVSPQCHKGEIWTDVDALGAVLDEVARTHRVDPDRVYVTGHSMGGRGALSNEQILRKLPRA